MDFLKNGLASRILILLIGVLFGATLTSVVACGGSQTDVSEAETSAFENGRDYVIENYNDYGFYTYDEIQERRHDFELYNSDDVYTGCLDWGLYGVDEMTECYDVGYGEGWDDAVNRREYEPEYNFN